MVETHNGNGVNIICLPSTMRCNIFQPPMNHQNLLPDHLLLLIFHNLTADVKSLNRCAALGRRFRSLISQIQHLTLHIPYHDVVSSQSTLIRLVTKPLKTLTQFISSKTPNPYSPSSLTKPLKLFKHIHLLKIQLPLPKIQIKDVVLLKWKAKFGLSLHNLVVLSTTSENPPFTYRWAVMRSCFHAARDRHYKVVYPLIYEHPKLTNLVLTDFDDQGMLCMDKEQLDEFRTMPQKSTLRPASVMRLWYEPRLELPDGSVLKGAMLAIVGPSGMDEKTEASEDGLVADAFQEEPYRTAAQVLFKGRAFIIRG